jgi:hypothetical protein
MTGQLDYKLIRSLVSGGAALGVLASVGIASSSAQAAVVTSGCAAVNNFCTLSELFGGATIQVGDKLFTNWDEIANQKNEGIVNTNNIQIKGIFQDTNAPGLQFMSVPDNSGINELSLGQGFTGIGNNGFGNLNLVFDFLVTSLGEPIVDNELSLDDFAVSGGFAGDRAFIEIFEDVGTTKGGDDLAQKSVEYEARSLVGVVRNKQFDSATFPSQQSIWVRKNINMFSTVEASASLTKFSQRFSQPVPEPTPILSFLALGTLGAGSVLLGRKK